MPDSVDEVVKGLQQDGEAVVIRAFQKSLANVEAVAKILCPVGHYARARGKPGRSGGDLRASLRAEYLGMRGDELQARLSSDLAYAGRQHEEELHHPGMYTGAPGDRYASKYFERSVLMIIEGKADPLAKYKGGKRATFEKTLMSESKM